MKAKRNISLILKEIFSSESKKVKIFHEEEEVVYYNKKESPRIKLIEKLFLKKKGSVLDVGCASGRESFYLAKKGFMVKGIDISKEMIYAAKKRRDREKLKNIKFEVADISSFKERGRYDYVMALFNVLTFIPDKEKRRQAIKNIIESVKPGGRAILDVNNKFGNIRIIIKQSVFKILFMLALKERPFGDVYSNPTLPGSKAITFQHYFSKREIELILKDITNIKYKMESVDLYTSKKDKNNMVFIIDKLK